MASIKVQPFTLHGHIGPNSWKVAIILETLSLPYTHPVHSTEELKQSPFITTLNPNGYAPVLIDPNNHDFQLFESNAIISYILSTHDTQSHLVSFPASSNHHFEMEQWLAFQTTFQTPPLTNYFYYTHTAPSTDPAVAQHFMTEALRVVSVLNTALNNKDWLVADKCSAADLSFIMHFQSLKLFLGGGDAWDQVTTDHPHVSSWLDRMHALPAVEKVFADRGKEFAKLSGKK